MKNIISVEAILMLGVGALLDGIGIFIFICGAWWGLDDYGTLEVIGGGIIGTWVLLRWLTGKTAKKPQAQDAKEEVIGSEKMEDWKQNKDGVYELNKKGGSQEKPMAAPKSPPTANKKGGASGDAKAIAKDLATGDLKGAAKKTTWKLLKIGLNYLVEWIPWLGGAWPGYTFMIYQLL